jgi:hypothetical protein
MMNQQTMRTSSDQFTNLLEAGRSALALGNRQQAHDLWKKAAQLNPYSEQIWLSLLDVIDNDNDRRVCLENILQINSLNVQARRELNKLDAREERRAQYRVERAEDLTAVLQRRRYVLLRAVLLGVAIGLSGAVFGVVMSVLVYAR